LIILRTMQQARYAAEPLRPLRPRDRLAYTHFTSPIRATDLIVHRILEAALRGDHRMPQDLPAIAEESSRRERVSDGGGRNRPAEEDPSTCGTRWARPTTASWWRHGVRDVRRVASVFVEGLVRISTFGDDYYEHLERQHALRGRRTRRTFRVSDPVRVEVAGVSVERRQIDFRVAGMEPQARKRGRRQMAKRRRS
jgi:ribonuclease R